MKILRSSIFALALALAGCAHYDRAAYEVLAARGTASTTIDEATCADHDAAAAALRAGPDTALVLPLIGRGPGMEDVADEHEVAAVVCRVSAPRNMEPALQERLHAAWAKIWAAGLGEVR